MALAELDRGELGGFGADRSRRDEATPARRLRHAKGTLNWAGTRSGERCALGVFRHAQVVEDQAHIAVELAHFLGDSLSEQHWGRPLFHVNYKLLFPKVHVRLAF